MTYVYVSPHTLYAMRHVYVCAGPMPGRTLAHPR